MGRGQVADMRPGLPLLAPSARRWAWALLACCAILVAVLGVLFAHQTTPDSFDHAVDSPIISWFAGDQRLSLWLAAPGSSIPATVLCAAIVVACLLTGLRTCAVLAAVALPAAVGLDDGLLKHLFHRTYLGQLTYPSGHTTAIFTLAAAVAVLFLGPLRPARTRPLFDYDIRLFHINKDMLKKISDYDQRPTCKETNCQRFDVNGNSIRSDTVAG